jgi:putative oxidoreductase
MAALSKWFGNNKDVGILLLRLFVGLRLIYGVIDNIVSWKHMKAFEGFLAANGFPFPLVSAVVSVYCQFISGVMIVIGYRIRIASALMIVNFIVAILMVHRHDTVEGMTPALAMLFGCITLLFNGSGKYSTRRE